MTNILLEGFDIDAPWLYDELKNYIKPNNSIAIIAFSFRDSSFALWMIGTLYTGNRAEDSILG